MKKIIAVVVMSLALVGCKDEAPKEMLPVESPSIGGEVEGVEKDKEPLVEIVEGIEAEVLGVHIRSKNIVAGQRSKYALELEIENTGFSGAMVRSDYVVINGIVSFTPIVADIPAEKTVLIKIDLENPDSVRGDFEFIMNVEMGLRVFTSGAEQKGNPTKNLQAFTRLGTMAGVSNIAKSGKLLYEGDGVSVYGEVLEDAGVRVTVENSGNEAIEVRALGVLVNGEEVGSSSNFGIIPPRRTAIVIDGFNPVMMEQKGIEVVEEAVYSLEIVNSVTGIKIADIGELKITR